MFDIGILLQRAGKVAAENSPVILTALGVTGVVSTAVLAAKGAFRSAEVIREAQDEEDSREKGHPFTTKEKLNLTWKLYIPAVISGGMTITAIICSNRISDGRTAAVATAYTFVEKNLAEYQRKTKEKLGEKKESAMRDELQEERFKQRDREQVVIITGVGKTNCWDDWTGRPFISDQETIRKAVNDFNEEVIKDGYGSLTQFYSLLNLPQVSQSDDIGWSCDRLLDVRYTSILEDGIPYLCVEFRTHPTLRFASMH